MISGQVIYSASSVRIALLGNHDEVRFDKAAGKTHRAAPLGPRQSHTLRPALPAAFEVRVFPPNSFELQPQALDKKFLEFVDPFFGRFHLTDSFSCVGHTTTQLLCRFLLACVSASGSGMALVSIGGRCFSAEQFRAAA